MGILCFRIYLSHMKLAIFLGMLTSSLAKNQTALFIYLLTAWIMPKLRASVVGLWQKDVMRITGRG